MTGTATAFVDVLRALASRQDAAAWDEPGDEPVGIPMRDLFAAAKAAQALPLDQVASLFDHDRYEVRMGAVCILDFRAKRTRTPDDERRVLYDLYLDHHDRITTWDMVDRAAPSVVGGYLMGRSSEPLHELTTSTDPVRRRTAITAPLWFVRYGSDVDLGAVFPIAAVLASDPDPLVHKAVGIALKHAGARDHGSVTAFLDEHSASMPRAAVRMASEKLPADVRTRFVRRP